MTLRAILFDLDDTLIDWGAFAEAWERNETPHIKKVFDHIQTIIDVAGGFETYRREYFTRTRQAWMEARNNLVAPHLGRVLVDAAVAVGVPREHADMERFLSVYEWTRVEGTSPFPEAADVLSELRDAGLRLGIVTNAFQPMWLRDVEMAAHGLLEFFPRCRISAADVGYLKPHPAIFERALNCIGTAPEQTIFIGDNPTADIAGAQSNGMRAVMRVTARRRPLISGLVVPDAAINSLVELLPILDEWFPGWRAGE
ncbi:MAG: HAD family hydrolase [Anaerolineaceae bacterium]|nr:MAG: HAD family hydrolase [Anaerolineaceae bacterium]